MRANVVRCKYVNIDHSLDILFPHSLPYRDILLVYPKENCALFALLAFSQTTRVSSVMSCFSLDETNLTNYLSKPDNYNIHSSSCPI